MVQVSNERLELRILELEDAVKALTSIASAINEALGSLNQVGRAHSEILRVVLDRLDDANDDDEPPWFRFKG